MCKTHENAKDMYVNTAKIDEIIYICQHIKIHEITYKYVDTLNVISDACGNTSNADTHATGMLLLQ